MSLSILKGKCLNSTFLVYFSQRKFHSQKPEWDFGLCVNTVSEREELFSDILFEVLKTEYVPVADPWRKGKSSPIQKK